MPEILRRTEFGNPVLREPASEIPVSEIKSERIQSLIKNMLHTLKDKQLGVGLAAPQVGESLALSVICIRPSKNRPDLPKEKWADLVIINPKIIETFGARKELWEGCISLPKVFARVPRYKKIRLQYVDEKGKRHNKIFESLLAHVIQHEVDHLNGVLYVDKVKDSSTFMSGREYRKRIVPNTEPE